VSGRERATVAVVADEQEAAMLCEWLAAAGFDALRLDGSSCLLPNPSIAACLVRWPVDVDLSALPRPVVLLFEPGCDVREAVGHVTEVLPLPDRGDVRSLLDWSSQLGSMLHHLTAVRAMTAPPPTQPTTPPAPCAAASGGKHIARPPPLLAIGVSTGGPTSLRVLFEGLRGAHLPPIVIVQHIPASFVPDLIHRLDEQTGYRFTLAEDGMPLQPGVAYMSPGDTHLCVDERDGQLFARWSNAPPFRGHRPSVEVLFDSCAALSQPGVAVMMTGMGRDGAVAMRRLRDQGWSTVGQDEASCAIYGMPQAARDEGATERELPLDRIAPWLIARCRRRAAPV